MTSARVATQTFGSKGVFMLQRHCAAKARSHPRPNRFRARLLKGKNHHERTNPRPVIVGI